VAIPEPRQAILDRGPFYVYVVPERGWIVEGRPLPAGAIRVGTASVEPEGGRAFAIRVSFTVPDVPGAYYHVQLCNDPCTVAGFREPLSAYISIVQTRREAHLLNELELAQRREAVARRQARRLERASVEMQTDLASSRSTVAELTGRLARLEAEPRGVAATPASSPDAGRPFVDAWALFGIAIAIVVALLTIGLALVFARRSAPRVAVPDTIAELGPLEDDRLTVR
jgi:hypothetical protein